MPGLDASPNPGVHPDQGMVMPRAHNSRASRSPRVVPAHLTTVTGALRGPSTSLPLPTSPPRALPASVHGTSPQVPAAARCSAARSRSTRPVHDSPAPPQPPH